QHDLVALADPKHAIPPYDAILLRAPTRAGDRALADALAPLVGAIDVNLMREANLRATGAGASPAEVARWLWGEVEKKKRAARQSVPAAVDERALLDPRHHAAQLLADLLGRMRGHLRAHRLERGLVDPVLQHPVLGELARLDVAEDAAHLRAGFVGDDARAAHVFAVFGG